MSPYLIACLVGASLCVGGHAGHADELNQDEVLKLRRAGLVAPFQDIVKSIAKRYPDVQFLEVELEADEGHYLYEIEILIEDGSVRELEIDAANGTILEDELED